ncbi:hypothetical protein [Bradyrhizobium sp. CCBAU 53415]|uniref:hypothetical protein n=1 Tax=Bradyrhizobium sp. CCBAU 53415 TaxID=1325119 RepID=UPI0023055B1F|nr:hypothetical protein [Bradyrhizobium sp. CCBAU 53415]MDA9469645.1 hypothetical protein [Bradyrhizobium sp. CCBAU 53415]
MPRFHVIPGDVPREYAARRLGLSLEDFDKALPNLIVRGFPKPDPDTGNIDLEAIDAWRRRRHPHLFTAGGEFGPIDASTVAKDRIEAMRQRKP